MRCSVILFIMIIVCIPVLSVKGAFWDVEQVYNGGFASGDTSLAINAANIPHVSYAANGSQFLAVKTIGGWNSETIAQVGFWGGWSSLAFNTSGGPCIAFIDGSGSTNYLKYAYKVLSSWSVETVDDVGWLPDYVSLAFNPAGQPCIAYCKTTGFYPDTHSYVCFARRTGPNTWVKQSIMEVGSITGPSLLIDSQDKVYIAFTESNTGKLKLASRSGTGSWQFTDIDGSLQSPAIWYTSLAFNQSQKPDIAYFISAGGSVELRYAYGGSDWIHETCTSMVGGSACYSSMAFTAQYTPMIAYYDSTTATLRNCWKSAGEWMSEDVDSSSQSGLRPSMKRDGLGNIEVSYFDNGNGSVKLASAIAPVSLQTAKCSADGTIVQLSGEVASSSGGELGSSVYIQESDRSSGIMMYFPSIVPPVIKGMTLDIQGQMDTITGERVLYDPDIVLLSTGPQPKPLGLANRELGGSDFYYSQGSTAGQRGVLGGRGLNNIGLLVSVWGRVKSLGIDYFMIDDGSGSPTKCYAPGIIPPAELSLVMVKGISSCEERGSDLVRMLRVRVDTDIVVLP